MGSHTLRVKCNHQCAALITESAQNRLWHLLTSALDICATYHNAAVAHIWILLHSFRLASLIYEMPYCLQMEPLLSYKPLSQQNHNSKKNKKKNNNKKNNNNAMKYPYSHFCYEAMKH